MKLFLIFLALVNVRVFSQNIPADLTIIVKNSNQGAMSKLELKINEPGSKQFLYALTNKTGSAKFKVQRGKKYEIGIYNNKKVSEISIPDKGFQPVTHNIIYDIPENRPKYDTTVFVNLKYRMPSDNEISLKIVVFGDKNKPMANTKVRLVCESIGKVFISNTEASGYALFTVYPGLHYDIGVDNFDKLGSLDIPDKGGMTSEARVFYQPLDIKETNVNDSITQILKKDQTPTSTHVLVQIHLWDMAFKPLPNEYIYMDRKDSKQVYVAKTNEKGFVYFLLPKGMEFSINLKYERDIDIINQPTGPDLHRINIEFNYMGSTNIENFYKTSKRSKEGFITEFMSPKATPCTFDPKWFEKTKNGFNINFPSNSSTSPPSAYKNKLLINSGYYTPEFYSLDGKTGKADWGARLSENGISSSVVVDDVILANTESCTLYALDANTGTLLWSKWLGPNIYSSPSVSNGKVLAVYPNELDSRFKSFSNLSNENHFVLAAFDLKTGKVLWQSWVDSEVLSAPVASNNKVYMTSMKGTLYQLDLITGKTLNVKKDKTISPPTIVDDFVFVTLQNIKDPKIQETAIYNVKDMKLISRFSQISGKNLFKGESMNAVERMNYNAGRVTHLKGKNFNVAGGKLNCFDNSGKISWQVQITNNTHIDSLSKCSMPVIVGNKIMINNGKKVQLYDPAQGKLIKEFDTHIDLFADAIAYNGWIYTGSKKGKIISIDTKDPSITGWDTWCGNPEHNPVIK